MVFWQRHGADSPGPRDSLAFPITGDGVRRVYEVPLSAAPGYQGAMIRLRIDPLPAGAPGDGAEIYEVRLAGGG